jgi:hypothetical protein
MASSSHGGKLPDEVPVEVRGLVPTPSGSGIFLTDGKKIITIFVDPSVSAAITMQLQGVKKPRPLTHDLIGSIFAGLGVRMIKVLVNDMKDDTFFARLSWAKKTRSAARSWRSTPGPVTPLPSPSSRNAPSSFPGMFGKRPRT